MKKKKFKKIIPHSLEFLKPSSLKHRAEHIHVLLKKKLWLKVLIALILGITFGIILGPNVGLFSQETSQIISEWVALPGNLFLSVIQMIVIPLIFASIIRGIAGAENIEQLKKTGVTITIYFIITTTVAITIGILLATWIQPGNYVDSTLVNNANNSTQTNENYIETEEIGDFSTIPSKINDLIPTNPISSMVKGEMLPLVIFTIIFGIALINLKPTNSKPILDLLESLQDVCLIIVKWAMLLAPLAVFGLMAKVTSQFGISTLTGLGIYILTVVLGLLCLMIFYMLIIFLFTKRNPFTFLSKIKDVMLLAFSTSSSAAVMPVSIKTSEEKLKLRPSISQFVIPIGATINMDGTALYQGIATIFLAQVYGVDIGITALLLLIVTIVGASIGTPGTPGVGIVILSVALTSVGIPLAGIALIIGVDRILDMTRTMVNVTGDLTATTFMDKYISKSK